MSLFVAYPRSEVDRLGQLLVSGRLGRYRWSTVADRKVLDVAHQVIVQLMSRVEHLERLARSDQPTLRCGDVYDPDGRPDDPPCWLPAGHDGWHSDGVGGTWGA